MVKSISYPTYALLARLLSGLLPAVLSAHIRFPANCTEDYPTTNLSFTPYTSTQCVGTGSQARLSRKSSPLSTMIQRMPSMPLEPEDKTTTSRSAPPAPLSQCGVERESHWTNHVPTMLYRYTHPAAVGVSHTDWVCIDAGLLAIKKATVSSKVLEPRREWRDQIDITPLLEFHDLETRLIQGHCQGQKCKSQLVVYLQNLS